MPSIKRWFHLSQEINRDPGFREYVKKFGLPGARLWLEFLAMFDRTDNFLDLHRGWDWGLLAANCESKKSHMLACYEHLVNIKWLRVGVDPDMKLFIYAPNWAKYNKKREDKGSMMDSLRGDENLHPFLTFPNQDKEKKKSAILDKPKRPTRQSFDEWWQTEILNNPTYAGIDLQRELGKMKTWLSKPENAGRKLNTRFALNWLNKIDPGVDVNGHGPSADGVCTRRVLVDGKSKPCTQPATVFVGNFGMCPRCHDVFKKERLAREGVSLVS